MDLSLWSGIGGHRESSVKIAERHRRRTLMNSYEPATPVRAFDRAYINGQFVTPHGRQIVDLVNPTDNKVIGKVTMADEIDARKAIRAAKEALNSFSQSSKEWRYLPAVAS